MATSSRVSLAWWCCSWAQARHWHSGRLGRIPATPLRGVLGEQSAVAGLGAADDLPKGPLMAAVGDHDAAALAGPAAAAGSVGNGEVVRGLGGPADPAAPVGGWLDGWA
jgi:hypothetical protein